MLCPLQANAAAKQQATCHRSYIWDGVLEWFEINGTPGNPKKLLRSQVSASTKYKELELKVDTWPDWMLMHLEPKLFIEKVGWQYLEDNKSVMFHIQASEYLDQLTEFIVNEYVSAGSERHESELNVDTWPSFLKIDLIPKHRIDDSCWDNLDDNKTVLFHIHANERLDRLTQFLVDGYDVHQRISSMICSWPSNAVAEKQARCPRCYVWGGVLQWYENINAPKNPKKHLRCQVSIITDDKEPKLKVDTWPKRLTMHLIPTWIIGHVSRDCVKDKKLVIFHIQTSEYRDQLTEFLVNGYVAFVYLPSPFSPTNYDIMILALFNKLGPEYEGYLGHIPNNQVMFIKRIKEVAQENKIVLMTNQMITSLSIADDMGGNMLTATMGAGGMSSSNMGSSAGMSTGIQPVSQMAGMNQMTGSGKDVDAEESSTGQSIVPTQMQRQPLDVHQRISSMKYSWHSNAVAEKQARCPHCFVWGGDLQWFENMNAPKKPKKLLRCQVSALTNYKESELKVDIWPRVLMMHLVPKWFVNLLEGSSVRDNFTEIKFLRFYIQPSEYLDQLTEFLAKGYVAFVYFPSSSSSQNYNIMTFRFVDKPELKAYMGHVPINQDIFFKRIREMDQENKICHMINQVITSLSIADGMGINMPTATMSGAVGMQTTEMSSSGINDSTGLSNSMQPVSQAAGIVQMTGVEEELQVGAEEPRVVRSMASAEMQRHPQDMTIGGHVTQTSGTPELRTVTQLNRNEAAPQQNLGRFSKYRTRYTPFISKRLSLNRKI